MYKTLHRKLKMLNKNSTKTMGAWTQFLRREAVYGLQYKTTFR